VYDRNAVDVLDRMKELVRTIEESDEHILKPFLSQSVTVADPA
jgi:hypothetical protein